MFECIVWGVKKEKKYYLLGAIVNDTLNVFRSGANKVYCRCIGHCFSLTVQLQVSLKSVCDGDGGYN